MVNCVIDIYKRGFIMGKNKKKQRLKKIKQNLTLTNILKFLCSCGVIGGIFILYGEFCVMQNKLDKLDEVPSKLSSLQTKLEDHIEYSKDLNESFKSELNGFKNTQNNSMAYKATNKISSLLYNATTDKDDGNFLSSPQWNDNDIIAKNPNSGRKYRSKDLKNKKILLTYTENGQDIYFYGQFNKYNHWDADCIINVYRNNKLQMIMEGQYTDGKLISYKQVIYYKNANRVVWSVSEREVNGDTNTGETYTYFKTKDKKANFNQKTVESSDILSIIDFRDWLDTPVEGYYSGNTSGGRYKDDSGQACLLKYNKKGKIRLFYCGKFENGHQEDSSGNAWDIVLGDDNKYHYRKAHYSNDKIDYNTVTYKKMGLSGREAEEKLKKKLGEKFKKIQNKCILSWKEDKK